MKSPGKRSARKTRKGQVLRAAKNKTIVVSVERKFRHPLYPKVVRRVTRFKAHDEKNECRAGDVVEIMETRPLSKTKHWRLVRILKPGRREGAPSD